mmetsp:Transcript_35243/g.101350  ORF Transcript_35243/g.101350 Transcript_35243/m.101350 type:complete len:260 (+) Transcript_35243:82-861(+)
MCVHTTAGNATATAAAGGGWRRAPDEVLEEPAPGGRHVLQVQVAELVAEKGGAAQHLLAQLENRRDGREPASVVVEQVNLVRNVQQDHQVRQEQDLAKVGARLRPPIASEVAGLVHCKETEAQQRDVHKCDQGLLQSANVVRLVSLPDRLEVLFDGPPGIAAVVGGTEDDNIVVEVCTDLLHQPGVQLLEGFWVEALRGPVQLVVHFAAVALQRPLPRRQNRGCLDGLQEGHGCRRGAAEGRHELTEHHREGRRAELST